MAEASTWKVDKKKQENSKSSSVESVNEEIKSLSISSDSTEKRRSQKRKDRKKVAQSNTTSPSSDSWTPPTSRGSEFCGGKKKFAGTRSKIPLPQRLSVSDSLCETQHKPLRYIHSSSCALRTRTAKTSSSSSSSQSSEASKLKIPKDQFRRSSDSHLEKGFLLPYGLRVQHAAHRCAWSESDNTSTRNSSCTHINMGRNRRKELGSASTLSPSTAGSQGRGIDSAGSNFCQQHGPLSRRTMSQQSKFEVYMPLCEVQQGLKRGEILEGVLRINPRNYEDAYISAPDGLTDIYIGGLPRRNRALHGDVVAVKLMPPEEWKILWDDIRDYEDRFGCDFFQTEFSSVDTEDELCTISENGWEGSVGPCMPDSLEIIGVSELKQQLNDFISEQKSKHRAAKSNDVPQTVPTASLASSSLNSVGSEGCDTLHVHEQNDALNVNNSLRNVKTDAECSAFVNDNENKSSSNSNPSCSNTGASVLGAQPVDNKTGVKDEKIVDGWEIGTDEPSWIVSPEDLFTLDNFEIPSFGVTPKVQENESLEEDKEDFCTLGAVAPDELSEDDFYSDTASTASDYFRERALDDVAYFASQQDAFNNNCGADNVPDAYGWQHEPDEVVVVNQQDAEAGSPPLVHGEFNLGSVLHNNEESSHDSSTNDETLNWLDSMIKPNSSALSSQDVQSLETGFSQLSTDSVPVTSLCEVSDCGAKLDENITGAVDDEISHVNELIGTEISTVNQDAANSVEEKYFVLGEGGKAKKKRHRKHKKKKGKIITDENLPENVQEKVEMEPEKIETPKKIKEGKKSATKKNADQQKVLPSKKNNFKNGANQRHLQILHNVNIFDIMQVPNWERFVQRTAKVVYIIDHANPRVAMGHIKLQQDRNANWALFASNDHRIPRFLVPMSDCPKGFYERPADFTSTLFVGKILDWDENSSFAFGRLTKSLGKVGEIEPETEGILYEHGVDFSDFPADVLSDLPDDQHFVISSEELAKRRDFRDICVFTIDPKTARDLDDAVSCRVLDGGKRLEIGVHIADVTHFIPEGSSLDAEASRRATSVYLVQKVVPMLPRALCEKLCSLNPGEDRLTFSVVWHMSPEGEIFEEWFGRTIIRSCVKMSYEHVQDMIEHPDKEFTPSELPPIFGDFSIPQIVDIVHKLQKVSSNLRRLRFHGGALRLDQVKIQFTLDEETGLPCGYQVHELKDSNRLIEELMLLANMAVAHKIYRGFPEKAFLRSHPPPQFKMLDDVIENCATMGIVLDGTSAGTLQASLNQYMGSDLNAQARIAVLTSLISKPMKPATYFCSGYITDPNHFHHYALNVPLYTHFTSPIRRYPDILVHRILATVIGLGPPPQPSAYDLQRCALHCNQKKLNAKRVHEMSCELFLAAFVKECGPLNENAVVIAVMDHSFDALIINMGVVKRIYCDKLPLLKLTYEKKKGVPQLSMTWDSKGSVKAEQTVTLFTMVEVILSAIPNEPLKFQATMKAPSAEPG